jgi:hypothetical protein
MNKKIPTPLTESYLQSMEGMQPAELPPYFYTRLKAKMEQSVAGRPSFVAKPALAIALLVLVLALNTVALVQQRSVRPKASGTINNDFNSFTSEFNLTTGSNY